MTTQRGAAIVLLVVILITNTAHADATSTRTVAVTQLHGTITIENHTTYSHVSAGFSETAETTCTTKITVMGDGSAAASISYTAHHVSDESSNGKEYKMTADLQVADTVAYNAHLKDTVGKDQSYQITADVPSVKATATRTNEVTGQEPVTSTWSLFVGCTSGYANVLLRGQVGQTTTLGGSVTAHGHFGWVNQEVGSSTETWSVVDPQLQSASRTCTAQAGQRALIAPGLRAMQVRDTPVAQGDFFCRWYGTIQLTISWKVGPFWLQGKPYFGDRGTCVSTLTFSFPDRVTGVQEYEWSHFSGAAKEGERIAETYTSSKGQQKVPRQHGLLTVTNGGGLSWDAHPISVWETTQEYFVTHGVLIRDSVRVPQTTFIGVRVCTAPLQHYYFDPAKPDDKAGPFSDHGPGHPPAISVVTWRLHLGKP